MNRWYFSDIRPLICQRDGYNKIPHLSNINIKCDKRIQFVRLGFVSHEAIIVFLNFKDGQFSYLRPVLKFFLIEDHAFNSNIEYMGADLRHFQFPCYMFLVGFSNAYKILNMLKDFTMSTKVFSFMHIGKRFNDKLINHSDPYTPIRLNLTGIDACGRFNLENDFENKSVVLDKSNKNVKIYYNEVQPLINKLFSKLNVIKLQDLITKKYTPFEVIHTMKFKCNLIKESLQDVDNSEQEQLRKCSISINKYHALQSPNNLSEFNYLYKSLTESKFLKIYLDKNTLLSKGDLVFDYFKSIVHLNSIEIDHDRHFFGVNHFDFNMYDEPQLFGCFYGYDYIDNKLIENVYEYNKHLNYQYGFDYTFNGSILDMTCVNVANIHLVEHNNERIVWNEELMEEICQFHKRIYNA